MNNTYSYRPYRSHTCFLRFVIPVAMLAFFAAGYCFQYVGVCVFFTVIGLVCTYLTKMLYDSSNMAVVFEKEGLRTIGSSYKDYRHFLWEEVLNAYYVRNFRGFLFLVISPKALKPKEAKFFANKGANLSKICIDDVAVIYIDDLQNVSQIKEIIDTHVAHVDSY